MDKTRSSIISLIILSIALAFFLGKLNQMFILVFLTIAFVAFIGLLWYNGQATKNKANDFIQTSSSYISSNNISVSKSFLSDTGLSRLIFDHENKRVHIFNKNSNPTSIPYSLIVESELIENGDTVTKTSRANQFGSAVVGGVLAGGLGAVVGGLSSKKTSAENVKSLEIKIVSDNLTSPLFSFFVKEYGENIEKSSEKYRSLYDSAYEIHKIISLIIRKQEEN